ncbi:MAG: hypothetical protein C0603_03090 [Denitrovibrio sp.]|nr:MAG: hypothetical protein C0603_03090 [Denitrovibrio sp.]
MGCVFIYSKNTLFRESLERIVSADDFISSVVSVDNMKNLRDVTFINKPKFIIVDLYSRSVDDNILNEIVGVYNDSVIVIATTIDNKHINYYHQMYGIKHYICVEDTSENIKEILQKVFSGFSTKDKFKAKDSVLTNRECEILKMIAIGNTSKEIAELLCISKNTVDTHRNKMLQKLNLANSASLVQYAYKSGLF